MKNQIKTAKIDKKSNSATLPNLDLDGLLALPPDATADELMHIAVQSLNQSGLYMVRAGQCFRRMKATLKHGEFGAALEARGIVQTHASRAMQLAEFMAGLSEADARKLIAAPYTKVLAIAQADPEVVEELVETGELEHVATLSVRDLRTQLKKLEAKAVTLETKLEAKAAQYEKLQHHLQHRHDHLQMPAFAAAAREETAALTEKMLLCLNSLDELVDGSLIADRDEVDADKFQAKAAGTLYHALLPIVARGSELLERISKHHKAAAAGLTFEHQLTKTEAKHYLKMRAALLEEHATEAKNRESLRENSREGKRGRKRAVRG